ncbi:ABC transporter permease [Actinocorallia longicatena]|uniref:ABC transporter permease n=1 Tax=Actinocorallia longicatena TaxID=111803 RepID=A0ABP6Q6Y3_9ACTN
MRPLALARRLVLLLALPAVLAGAWWAATEDSTDFFWPPLSDILGTFGETWFTGRFTADVLPSLARLLAGYLVALVLGVGLGVAIGSFRTLRGLVEPVMEFFRAIPPPVLVPILMLFAGIGNGMKVLVIVSGCLWPVLLNTVEGVRSVDEVLRDTARCYRLRPHARIIHLVLPGAGPRIFAGARQALSIGIILMVISEMFAASDGIGFTVIQFQRSFAIPQMWTGIIMLGLIGIVLSLAFHALEARVLSWYTGQRRAQREG